MGVNKVVFGAVPIMDISDSTVTPETLAKGVTAYDKSGEKITGKKEDPTFQEKTVTPSVSSQDITPDSGKVLSKVTVNGDSNLVPENIKNGVSIFGVTGSLSAGANVDTATVTLTISEKLLSWFAGGWVIIATTLENGRIITKQQTSTQLSVTIDNIIKGTSVEIFGLYGMVNTYSMQLSDGLTLDQTLPSDSSVLTSYFAFIMVGDNATSETAIIDVTG